MLARLGFVIYVLACIVALVPLGMLIYGAQSGDMYTIGYFVFGGAALAIILIGRTIYYILSGN